MPCLAVYLLDDGRDIDKKKFIRGLGVSNAVYVRWAPRQGGRGACAAACQGRCGL